MDTITEAIAKKHRKNDMNILNIKLCRNFTLGEQPLSVVCWFKISPPLQNVIIKRQKIYFTVILNQENDHVQLIPKSWTS